MAKIKLEKDYRKVTVGQYVEFVTNEGNEIGQAAAFIGQPKDVVRELPPHTIAEIIEFFKGILEEPVAEHQHKWKNFGFVPDINKISFGEWLDLESNCKDFPKNLNKILAILYRPITSEIVTKYKIEPYSAEHLANADQFNDMPLSIANGALVFFSNIEKELLNRSLEFFDTTMNKEMMKAITMMEEALKQQTT